MNGEHGSDGAPRSIDAAKQEMARISRKSFLWAGASLLSTAGIYWWLDSRSTEGGKPWPFRRAFELDEQVARTFGQGVAKSLPAAEVSSDAKVNGLYGLAEVPRRDWRLRIEGLGAPRVFTLDQLKALPATEQTNELNCIEGWTRIMRWRGITMRDLLSTISVEIASLPSYLALETPKRGYYVGLERESAVHPQSLLAYELNGQPLSDDHGGPLRHVLPIKYGYKQLKHVGLLRFTAHRPADYWAEQGYDWYGGF